MKISRALSVFTHLMALVGFLSVFISGGVGVPSAVVFFIALAASFVSELYGKNYYVGDRVGAGLAVLLVAYSGAGIIVFRFEPFRVILDFLIFTQVLKLLGKKRMRDVVQIFLLSFFQFLAGAIITVSFSFAIAFVLYIAAAIWALMAYEMRKGSLDSGASGRDCDPGVVTPMFLSTTFLLSFCIFLLAALIFVTVSRMRGNYLRTDFMRSGELRSGFSDEVKLGKVGEIKLDSSPVMMVRILNRAVDTLPAPLYWRGIALEEFDGSWWRATGGGRYGGPEPAPYKRTPEGRGREGHLAQEVITESLDTDVLFAANFPVSYSSVPGGRVAQVTDSFIPPGGLWGRIKYVASSNFYPPQADDLRAAGDDYSEIDPERYLQLPPLAPEVSELALEITSSDRNAYDKALALDSKNTAAQTKLALIKDITSGQPRKAASRPAVAATAPQAARPAPRPTPATATAAAAPGVEAAVAAWAQAWSNRDADAYLAAYADDFSGAGMTRAAWEAQRRARITAPKRIEVRISDLKVEQQGDTAKASFRQAYRSDRLNSTVAKTLELAQRNGQWRIVGETSQ